MGIDFKTIVNKFLLVVFLIWIAVLIFRSGIHVRRIFAESTTQVPGYHEDVEICGDSPIEEEKLMYYRYINLGVECEN